MGDGAEPGGFHISGFVNSGWNALTEEMQQGFVLPCGWLLQQFGQGLGLLSGQRQGRDALGFAVGGQLAIRAQHGEECAGQSTILPDRVCCQ